jgi:hypothetical protein
MLKLLILFTNFHLPIKQRTVGVTSFFCTHYHSPTSTDSSFACLGLLGARFCHRVLGNTKLKKIYFLRENLKGGKGGEKSGWGGPNLKKRGVKKVGTGFKG